MCPISLMCLIFLAKNVGNNIKREETYSQWGVHMWWSYVILIFMFFSTLVMTISNTFRANIWHILHIVTTLELYPPNVGIEIWQYLHNQLSDCFKIWYRGIVSKGAYTNNGQWLDKHINCTRDNTFCIPQFSKTMTRHLFLSMNCPIALKFCTEVQSQ